MKSSFWISIWLFVIMLSLIGIRDDIQDYTKLTKKIYQVQ